MIARSSRFSIERALRNVYGEVAMIEELKEEKLVEKVGGRFRLSSLIQKRLVVLNRGSAPYVDAADKKDKLQIVVQEILEDKIYLNMDGELVENIQEPLPMTDVPPVPAITPEPRLDAPFEPQFEVRSGDFV